MGGLITMVWKEGREGEERKDREEGEGRRDSFGREKEEAGRG
jgi:hypothetical protein